MPAVTTARTAPDQSELAASEPGSEAWAVLEAAAMAESEPAAEAQSAAPAVLEAGVVAKAAAAMVEEVQETVGPVRQALRPKERSQIPE